MLSYTGSKINVIILEVKLIFETLCAHTHTHTHTHNDYYLALYTQYNVIMYKIMLTIYFQVMHNESTTSFMLVAFSGRYS